LKNRKNIKTKRRKELGLLASISHVQMSRKFVVLLWKTWLIVSCLKLIHHNGVGFSLVLGGVFAGWQLKGWWFVGNQWFGLN